MWFGFDTLVFIAVGWDVCVFVYLVERGRRMMSTYTGRGFWILMMLWMLLMFLMFLMIK